MGLALLAGVIGLQGCGGAQKKASKAALPDPADIRIVMVGQQPAETDHDGRFAIEAWKAYGALWLTLYHLAHKSGHVDAHLLESSAREALASFWAVNEGGYQDDYLDRLAKAKKDGLFEPFVIAHHATPGWTMTAGKIKAETWARYGRWAAKNGGTFAGPTKLLIMAGDVPLNTEWRWRNVPGRSYEKILGVFKPGPEICRRTDAWRIGLDGWKRQEKELGGIVLASMSRKQLVDALSRLATKVEAGQIPKDTRVIWASPAIAHFLMYAGVCAIERGEPAEALAPLDTFEKLGAVHPTATNERILALMAVRRIDDALRIIDRVLAADKDPCVRARYLRHRGIALIEQGELGKARASFSQSLAIEPGNRIAKKELDVIAAKLGELDPKKAAALGASSGGGTVLKATRSVCRPKVPE